MNFEELVSAYMNNITSQVLLQTEYGSSLGEKILNHKIRKHILNPRNIAKYLTAYTDWIGAPVRFKDCVEPQLYERVRKLVVKSADENGNIGYGYYKGEEEGNKYFFSNVKAPIKSKSSFTILDTNHIRLGTTVRHIVIVTSSKEPRIGDVAVNTSYHPNGYGCWNDSVKKLDTNLWKLEWVSSNTCD